MLRRAGTALRIRAVTQIEGLYAPFTGFQQKDAQFGVFTETGGKNTA